MSFSAAITAATTHHRFHHARKSPPFSTHTTFHEKQRHGERNATSARGSCWMLNVSTTFICLYLNLRPARALQSTCGVVHGSFFISLGSCRRSYLRLDASQVPACHMLAFLRRMKRNAVFCKQNSPTCSGWPMDPC